MLWKEVPSVSADGVVADIGFCLHSVSLSDSIGSMSVRDLDREVKSFMVSITRSKTKSFH